MKQKKSVDQLDLNGNVLNTFSSVSEAAKAVNGFSSGISRVLNDENKTCKGYK